MAVRASRDALQTIVRCLLCALAMALCWNVATAQVIARVSVSSSGEQGNADSALPAISGDGRFVAFLSQASNLVPNDWNGVADVFVHDRQTGETTRVSVSSDGVQAYKPCTRPAISMDGRFVILNSQAANLVPGDLDGNENVFLHDRHTGETTCVSVSGLGIPGDKRSGTPAISADGRSHAFASAATNLVPGDTNGTAHPGIAGARCCSLDCGALSLDKAFSTPRDGCDVFVRDMISGEVNRVSVSSLGEQGDGPSGGPALSASGRFVTFGSLASTLVPGDTNGCYDVFVHDLQTGETTRVSVSSFGEQANGDSRWPEISGDGRFVTFQSRASNLVPGDTNDSYDVFVHDRQTGHTGRVSGPQGLAPPWHRSFPRGNSLNPNGRLVAFASYADDLVPGDRNGVSDIFVRDLQTGQITLVTFTGAGVRANGPCSNPCMTASSERFSVLVAFDSEASNLVPNDTNRKRDVFIGVPQLQPPTLAGAPVLSWPNTRGFTDDGVAPNIGTPDQTLFEFQVKLHDTDNDEPDYVRLVLYKDGVRYQTLEMEGDGRETMLGRVYRIKSKRSLPDGQFAYCFRAGDDDGSATGVPTQRRRGPSMTAVSARLVWRGGPGCESDGVSPDTGQAYGTCFRFQVKYRCADGEPATRVRLVLQRDELPYATLRMATRDPTPDPAVGVAYEVWRALPPGEYSYHFEATNRYGAVEAGPAIYTVRGPVVLEGRPLLIASLAVAPAATGSQITFVLYSSAQVHARILNVAGRQVRTLCRTRHCDAGTNTLLWNARSDRGLAVPNGTYIAEVRVTTPDGRQARALTQVRIDR